MPGHYQDPTIYDLIASQAMSATTITQLNNATKNTFIEKTNIEFWSGVITVARALEESRTYGHGLPIPEGSGVTNVTIADGATGEIKPQGSEIWLVESIDNDNCVSFLIDGGAGAVPITADLNTAPLYLTPTLYIAFSNASGGEQTPGIAYHKVSL